MVVVFKMYGDYKIKTAEANFLSFICSYFYVLTDTREEWEKDRWDVRVLYDQYGIAYNQSKSHYYLDFTTIERVDIRDQIKRYIKKRMLSHNFSWSTSYEYLNKVSRFFSFIFSLNPTWSDLKGLKRFHIEKYIEFLHESAKSNVKRKDINRERYVSESLFILGKFLEDIQLYDYEIVPEIPVKLLILPEDKPRRIKKSIDQIDYIPEFVLEQLFKHINDLHKEIVPVVWVAFKTGLRISDVLGLNWDCLERLNGKYSVVTDIEKTYVQGHRIPIDDDLANILAVLIQQSKDNSNQDNNPNKFIFICYSGARKGKPYPQHRVQTELNKLAIKKQVVDGNGKLFHFKAHQFRHTYAVKMLNGGADILTVQELLAHASPEMTLRYAKLLDDTKRKAFRISH